METPSLRKIQVHLYRPDPLTEEPLFLVLRRPRSRGSVWQPVTGNTNEHEDARVCALREVEEETGLVPARLVWITDFEFQKSGRIYHEDVYAAECTSDEVVLSDEHEEYQWLPFEEARDLIHFESNKKALEETMRVLSGSAA